MPDYFFTASLTSHRCCTPPAISSAFPAIPTPSRIRLSPLRFRPWLQAFRDYAFDKRVFGAAQIRAQIDAAESAGSDGWMLWNPRNTYTADGLHPRQQHDFPLEYGARQPADQHR